MQTQWPLYYQAPARSTWHGRQDSLAFERYFQLVDCIDLRDDSPLKAQQYALLGFACDEGIKRNLGRVGAKEGPTAFRSALANLAWHGSPQFQFYDVGDIVCHDGNLEAAQQSLAAVVAYLISKKVRPIVIGGGHEIAWGHYLGLTKAYPKQAIGIVNFDAHLDLRPMLQGKFGTSGTPFLQIAEHCESLDLPFQYACIGVQATGNTASLMAQARALNTTMISADDIQFANRDKAMATLQSFLDAQSRIYLTICLDVFAMHLAPGVSAPQTMGLTHLELMPMLDLVLASDKVVSIDIAELSPPYDLDMRTAKLAGLLINHYLQFKHA